jgi:GNAT superfamily N-acetyltransferase
MASEIRVRDAMPQDRAAAELLFDSAPMEFTTLAGSPERARRALGRLWARRGHSMSFEHSAVAELEGHIGGVAVGFPCNVRYRLHFGLLRQGAREVEPCRRLLIPPAVAWLVAATPRPPRDGFYIAAIAVDRRLRRRGVATALFDSMGARAKDAGFSRLVGHTGARHTVMRSTAERYGFRTAHARAWGYVLYELRLAP